MWQQAVRPPAPAPVAMEPAPRPEADMFNNHDHRAEERWHGSIDRLVRDWRAACLANSRIQDNAGYNARWKHIVFGMPAPIATLVTAAVAGLWQSEDARYFVVPLTCVAAVFSVVHTYLDMGGRAQQHWNFSARYGSVANRIDMQLCRDIDFRRPADEFVTEVMVEVGNLNTYALKPPPRGFWGCGEYDPLVVVPEPDEEARAVLARRAAGDRAAFLESNQAV
jgi:hypothetical protein